MCYQRLEEADHAQEMYHYQQVLSTPYDLYLLALVILLPSGQVLRHQLLLVLMGPENIGQYMYQYWGWH